MGDRFLAGLPSSLPDLRLQALICVLDLSPVQDDQPLVALVVDVGAVLDTVAPEVEESECDDALDPVHACILPVFCHHHGDKKV